MNTKNIYNIMKTKNIKEYQKKYQKEYRENNKEKIKEYQSKYREENRELNCEFKREYNKKYYEDNKDYLREKQRAYKKEYYKKNKERKEMQIFKELNERVINWADQKGILLKATPFDQIKKTIEEVDETKEALFAQKNNMFSYLNSKGKLCNTSEEIKDGIGDTLVTLLIQCKMQNLNPLDCLESALNIIEKRTGKMIDGQFVKDE